MKLTTVGKRPWLIHAIANCTDCNWQEDDYHIAVRKGRDHAKRTGHKVSVETGYAQIYNDRKG